MVCRSRPAVGVLGMQVDGNDVEAVYHATSKLPCPRGPVLIEAITFRMNGHAEHDDASYAPKPSSRRGGRVTRSISSSA